MANAIHPNTGERQAPGAGGSYPGERHPADEAKGIVKEQADIAKDRAGAMLNDAKENARSKIEERKSAAADGVGEFAGALRDAARSRRHGEDDPMMRLTETAADGLERLSGMLRSKDVGSMLSDVNQFARRQPVAFFGLALAAGFVAARLMKDTRSGMRSDAYRDDDLESYRDTGPDPYRDTRIDTDPDTGLDTSVDTRL
jgi:hypothetical protein